MVTGEEDASAAVTQTYVGRFLETFKDYPPRMEAASFSLDQVMEKLKQSQGE